jgi:hypothetical protein
MSDAFRMASLQAWRDGQIKNRDTLVKQGHYNRPPRITVAQALRNPQLHPGVLQAFAQASNPLQPPPAQPRSRFNPVAHMRQRLRHFHDLGQRLHHKG